jgi:3-(3-hydroxy-phenyl)propionate hydroxylase
MAKPFSEPPPVTVGDRAPDGLVHDSNGRQVRLHDLFGRSFVALYFTDTRRRPDIPQDDAPWLAHYVVSRWDAPCESPVRQRTLFDPASRLAQRYGCPSDTIVLVRPDDHVAAIEPMAPGRADMAYRAALAVARREAVPA